MRGFLVDRPKTRMTRTFSPLDLVCHAGRPARRRGDAREGRGRGGYRALQPRVSRAPVSALRVPRGARARGALLVARFGRGGAARVEAELADATRRAVLASLRGNHPTLFWVPGTARARARTLSPRARGRRVAHQLMRPVEPADADVHDPRDARGSVDVERLLERHPLLLAASAVRGVDASDRRARPERAPARAPREVRAREPAHGRRQARARDRHRVSSAENTTRGPRAACLCASRARDGGGAFGEGVSVPRVAPLAGFSPAESDRGGSGFARPSQRARLTEPRARSIRSRFGRGRLFVHTNFGAQAVPRLETRGRNSTAWDRFRRFRSPGSPPPGRFDGS